MTLWLYSALYLLGLILGAAGSRVFDMHLRRPGMRQSLGLVFFALLLWAVLTVSNTPFTEIILPLVWLGTGILAGAGSRTRGAAAR